jgi:glycosyltransferase involved in cell wall biosynthesis
LRDVEIVVVDDGSTDATPLIVRKFVPHIRTIFKHNGGQASAFNAAIPTTRSQIVAFLDGDDWWAKDKLSRVYGAFEQDRTVAAVGHGYYEVLGENPPTEMVVADHVCKIDSNSPETAAIANLGRTMLATSRLSVRREILDRIGKLPETLTFCADAPILSLSLFLGGAIILDKPLCYYRLHENSLFSHSVADRKKTLLKAEMLDLSAQFIRGFLERLNVDALTSQVVLEAYQIEIDRIRFSAGDRNRWKSLMLEFRELRSSYDEVGISYLTFKSLVAIAAFFLTARQFARMRDWYSRNDLKRYRQSLITTKSTAEGLFERRPVEQSLGRDDVDRAREGS